MTEPARQDTKRRAAGHEARAAEREARAAERLAEREAREAERKQRQAQSEARIRKRWDETKSDEQSAETKRQALAAALADMTLADPLAEDWFNQLAEAVRQRLPEELTNRVANHIAEQLATRLIERLARPASQSDPRADHEPEQSDRLEEEETEPRQPDDQDDYNNYDDDDNSAGRLTTEYDDLMIGLGDDPTYFDDIAEYDDDAIYDSGRIDYGDYDPSDDD